MFIEDSEFLRMVSSVPLVSIDLIVRDGNGGVLLGLRKNEPAAGYWFTPGGRILKDESLATAFRRIAADELGAEVDIGDAAFIGVFEHHHQSNFRRVPGISTHYIVLAFEWRVDRALMDLPLMQHDRYRWFGPAEIDAESAVHPYVRDYFLKQKGSRP